MPKGVEAKLAFIYVVHQQVGLFEILLHLTFRPYNAYCIYVGNNTNSQYTSVLKHLVNCYKKLYPKTAIFMATNTSKVEWGKFSLLNADLHCMQDLLKLNQLSLQLTYFIRYRVAQPLFAFF